MKRLRRIIRFMCTGNTCRIVRTGQHSIHLTRPCGIRVTRIQATQTTIHRTGTLRITIPAITTIHTVVTTAIITDTAAMEGITVMAADITVMADTTITAVITVIAAIIVTAVITATTVITAMPTTRVFINIRA